MGSVLKGEMEPEGEMEPVLKGVLGVRGGTPKGLATTKKDRIYPGIHC